MGHSGTPPEVLERAVVWCRGARLVPLVARKESLGFVANRVWHAVRKDALAAVDEGVATPEAHPPIPAWR